MTVVRARPSVLIAYGLLSVALRAFSSSKSAQGRVVYGGGGVMWCVCSVWVVGEGWLSRQRATALSGWASRCTVPKGASELQTGREKGAAVILRPK